MASNTLGPYVKTPQLERFKSKADTIYATKAEVAQTVASAYIYRGTVDTYAELPSQDLSVGDVYNVVAAYGNFPGGTNFAWNGTFWDALGGSVDLSPLAPKASPAFTGTPTAPTASTGTDTTQVATTAFVQQEISANAVSVGNGLYMNDNEISLSSLVGTANPMVGAADAKLAGLEVVGACAQASAPSMSDPVAITHTVMTAFVASKGGTDTSVPLSVELYGLSNGTGDTVTLDQYGNKTVTRVCGKLTISDFNEVFRTTDDHTTFQATPSDAKHFAYGTVAPMFCTHAAIVNQNMDWVPGTVSASLTGSIFLNVDPSITTVQQLAEAYPTLEVIYPLATPTATSSGAVTMPTVGEGCSISVTHTGADPNSVTPTWWLSAAQALVDGQALQDARIDSIESASEVNVIETVKVNGNALTPDANKAVDVTVPTKTSDLDNDAGFITSSSLPTAVSDLTNDTGFITSSSLPTNVSDLNNDTGFITSSSLPTNVSDLNNDAGYQTASDVETAVNSAIAGLYDFKGSVATYADLPNDASAGDVYNVVAEYQNTPAGTNYAWTGTSWDALGGEIDLSGYATTASLATVATTGAYSDLSGKPEVDSALSGSSTNAVQNQAVKAALDLKAPLASPALTGTPTAPTASAGTNSTQVATTAFVKTAIDGQATATTSAKGLMSSTDKSKLDGIEAQATKNSAGDGITDTSGVLSLGPLVKSGSGASVQTDGCALYSVEGEGYARQVSTTGKNLLDPNGTNISMLGNKLTNTVTDSKTAFNLVVREYGSGAYTQLVNTTVNSTGAKTFTFTTSSSFERVEIIHNGSQRNITISTLTSLSASTAYVLSFNALGYNPSTVGGLVLENPQLESGSTATSYEPYSGGTPGPNPSYPFPIEVARGRNLLENGARISNAAPFASTTASIGSADFYESEPLVSCTSSTYIVVSVPSVPTGTECTLSFDASRGTYNAIRLVGSYGNETLADIGVADKGAWRKISISFVMGAYSYIRIGYNGNAGFYVRNFQLELGSTPTPYVPYGNVGLEVVSDLLDESTAIDGYFINSSGVVTSIAETSYCPQYIEVVPDETLTVEFTKPATTTMVGSVVTFYDLAKSFLSRTVVASGDTAAGFKTGAAIVPTNAKYARMHFPTGSTGVKLIRHTVTPVPIPPSGLAKLTGATDTLEIDSAGHVVCPLGTGEKVFTGDSSENWEMQNSGARVAVVVQDCKAIQSTSTVCDALCSHFKAGSPNNTWVGNDPTSGFYIGSCFSYSSTVPNTIYFTDGEGGMTAANFKTWLSTHNVTVRYPLATPTTWDGGYIDLPELPQGSVVSCPELDAVGVSWWVAGAEAAVEHGLAMLARADAELYEAEQAIADLSSKLYEAVTETVNLKNPNTQITLRGFRVGSVTVLYGSVTCAASSATSQPYLEFGGTAKKVTSGTWTISDITKSGVVQVVANDNAWLLGVTAAELSEKNLYLSLIQYAR